MWLAGHTYAFRSLPLDEALARLNELGLGDVEVWLGHARDGPAAAADDVAAAGVRVRAVSAGGYYDARAETPERAFELAETLGVDLVVMCVAPHLVARLERLAPAELRVAVENHWDQPLARSREVSKAIRGSRLEACLDTGHALAAGERAEAFAERLGERLAHVHLKDGRLPSRGERVLGRRARRRLLGKPEPVWPGDGNLDLAALGAALARAGFDGCVTVEYEGDRPEDALAALAADWRGAA